MSETTNDMCSGRRADLRERFAPEMRGLMLLVKRAAS
jgi:hypothetical protein